MKQYKMSLLFHKFHFIGSGIIRIALLMKTKRYIFLLYLLSSLALSAQDTARTIDRVFTTDGVYIGQITTDQKGDYLVIDVPDKASYTISYSNITKIQYNVDNPKYVTSHRSDPAEGSEPTRKPKQINSDDLLAFNGYRASGGVTDKLIKKRNMGIGLTIGGGCLIGLGAVVFAVTPRYIVSNQNGYLVSSVSPGAIIGVLMMAGGIGISIPGAAIWGSSVHKIHKAEQEN